MLPEDEKIPRWTPYQLRHAAATAMEDEGGLDDAHTLLDHSSTQMTKKHTHRALGKHKQFDTILN